MAVFSSTSTSFSDLSDSSSRRRKHRQSSRRDKERGIAPSRSGKRSVQSPNNDVVAVADGNPPLLNFCPTILDLIAFTMRKHKEKEKSKSRHNKRDKHEAIMAEGKQHALDVVLCQQMTCKFTPLFRS